MTSNPRRTLFLALFLTGLSGILWLSAGFLPERFGPQPEPSPHIEQSRRETEERMARDPAFRKWIEQLRAEFEANRPVEAPYPWYCIGPMMSQCTAYRHASENDKGSVVAAGLSVVFLTFIWIGILRRLFRPTQLMDHGILGSAGFATAKELATAQQQARGNGTVPLGLVGKKYQTYDSDKHVLMIVANRSGKGVSYILPSLLSYQGSVFVNDPKGENATISAHYRAGLGKVCVIDPWKITQGEAAKHCTSFNPLRAILQRGEARLYADAQALAGAMIVASGEQRNDHWNQSAEQLLTALIAHVCTAQDIQKRDMVTVRELLMHNFYPVIDPETNEGHGTSTIEQMMANPACNRNIAAEAESLWHTPDNERGGILSSARKQTQFLDEAHLADSLRDNGNQMDFADWKSGIMSCYLCVPAPYIERYARWLRVVITAALDSMIRELSPPALPVQFILDELAFLGRLPVIEAAFGLAAGYGVQVWAIFQDVGQMRDLYKERAPTFWNNAGVRIAFAAHDHETAKYISDNLGTATITVTGYSTGGTGPHLNQSLSQHARPLLNPDEVSRGYARETGKALIFLDAIKPLQVTRVLHYRDEPFKSRADTPNSQT